jgi:hypothetical protein
VTSSEGPCAALRAHLLTYDTPFREIEHRPAASALEYHQVVGSRLTQQANALLLRRYRDDGGKEYVIYSLPAAPKPTLTRCRQPPAARA